MVTPKRLPAWKEEVFPNLFSEGYEVTSEEDGFYNCIGWVNCDKSNWWSPIEHPGYAWPKDVGFGIKPSDFVVFFRKTWGFEVCDDEQNEPDFEKIALYQDAVGHFSHVALQLPCGEWTSKLGPWEDIRHKTLKALESQNYGKVCLFMKRPKATFSSTE